MVLNIITEILKNTSLWEVIVLIIVLYLMLRPKLINRITRFKVGDFEVELSELKKEVKKGTEKILELESELEYEKRQFEDLLESFDANAPLNELSSVRQTIIAQAKSISEDEVFKKYLNKNAKPEELYAAAVGIREKRIVNLLPDIISLLDQLADDKKLGGFRLNTIWTLTSAIHKILISCVRDNVGTIPSIELLEKSEYVLKKLSNNPRVLLDRPDNPMRGIRGPIKYSLDWITKAKDKISQND